MIRFLKNNALYLAWVVSLIGFCLSIFFGEVLQYTPCPLCWYQRIALFPLALILGIASFRSDAGIIPYAIPLAVLGGIAAIVQSLEGRLPMLQEGAICHQRELCSEPVFTLFSFITFPVLSAIGFILIIALLSFYRKKRT